MDLQQALEQYFMPAAKELVQNEGDALRCLACGNRCLIREGETGICRMRANRKGELCVPGGYVAGLSPDPIEKKPFYHVLPGELAMSFGMLGCNLHCSFCQNWISSQALKDQNAVSCPHSISAEAIVDASVAHDAPVIVSTYNEPLITAEWAVEIFKRAQARGILCGYVSNGNATPEALAFIRPYVSMYKVDLKTFNEANYRELGCPLQHVLDSITLLHDMGFWVEVVTLVIPGFNDSEAELHHIAAFLASVSRDIPWHVTAFHPDYNMTERRRTSAEDLERACKAGKDAGLHYIYAGNLPGVLVNRENTSCPACGALLIQRRGYHIIDNHMQGSACSKCGARIAGLWERPA